MGWFSRSHQFKDFDMYSQSHLVILAIYIFMSVIIFLNRNKWKDKDWRKTEIGIAISLILFEGTNQVWMYVNGIWKVGRSLPLELCNIGLILCVILLLTRKKVIFELLFFIAILGANQAIFTPALTYEFPHFRFLHFFYAHMVIVWVSLYFMWVKRYFPTFQTTIKLILFINILLPVILYINKQADGNYWFLRYKPKSPSLFDVLGPYPWYIFSLESILILLSFLTWFILRKWAKREGEHSPSQ